MQSFIADGKATLIETNRFTVKIAETLAEIESALKLRFQVFNLEMNEGLQSSFETGFDSDVFDTFCDHLIVRDRTTEKTVGTYRLLRQEKAEQQIGFYSEGEFDLTILKKNTPNAMELGRSCVAKEFRSAPVINLLWSGIGRYIEMYGITHLFGCASIHTHVGHTIAPIHTYLSAFHLAPSKFRVHPLPHCVLELPSYTLQAKDHSVVFSSLPPLVKGYIRLGAVICGDPAIDREFGTTDYLILLDTDRISSKYKSHFQAAGSTV